jgi:hypothetical protein
MAELLGTDELEQWFSTWGTCIPRAVSQNETQELLEPAVILTLTKIRPQI